MADRIDTLGTGLAALDRELGSIGAVGSLAAAVERWRTDCLAMLFHLRDKGGHRPLVGVLGGTGTGKSTVVNRLMEAEVSATSLRRTFTSGAIAIAKNAGDVPDGWLGLPREVGGGGAVRGRVGVLAVVELDRPLTTAITLVDTPDLDGDQPVHQAEADRVFRWAQAMVFLVTPEKYQMTELLPYYRLAKRYALPAVFVMNKCEEAEVLEDYRRQLGQREWADARVFAIPRDDAAYEPAEDRALPSLRGTLAELPEVINKQKQEIRRGAMGLRLRDLLGRLDDQILEPMRQQRAEVDRLTETLRAMASPAAGVDVSPVTQQLQRRLQEQSVLYLMGPQRILDRVRQVPGLLVRLPRTAWDVLVKGRGVHLAEPGQAGAASRAVPDFPKLLADQFTILQSRVEDLLLSSPTGAGWMNRGGESYRQVKMPPAEAGKIADEELAGLKAWLEQRWHGTPRDTAVLMKLLKLLPGGKKLTKWSEAAPYLLAAVVAAHHAFLGPVDLIVLGSYSLAMWLGEKLSNEVTWRTRQANRRIGERFAELSQEQIERVCVWLEKQAPSAQEIRKLTRMAESVAEMMDETLVRG
ncbi:MAG: GTPase domain-containing protein [Planctomycetota bacterium]|nr:GTPase domain-containing protein [Planctomycetota bacterium]